MSSLSGRRSLVIGAGSAIAQEIITQSLTEEDNLGVIAVSRSRQDKIQSGSESRLQWFQSDYSELSMADIVSQLLPPKGAINRVYICNGILHDSDIFPEKRLQDFSEQSLHRVMLVNAIIPILWIKHLAPLLKDTQDCVITVFSARIGSIGDNRSGGWYSYRASKSALNMLLKTAAIEYSRRAPQIRFLAFHPGTVDTPLSMPFQKSVPAEKLFTPAFVANRLLTIIEELQSEESIQYLDWDGKPINW